MTSEYIKPNFNELNKLKTYYLKHIYFAARFFNDNFVGKEIIYKTKSKKTYSIIFKKRNFMHLCGIYYEDGSLPFFDLSLKNNLDINKIQIKNDGTTFQKLKVLEHIHLLISHSISMIGKVNLLYLSFDCAIRTKKQIFALTLINDSFYYVPNSILDLNARNNLPKGDIIVEISSISLDDEDKNELILINNRLK